MSSEDLLVAAGEYRVVRQELQDLQTERDALMDRVMEIDHLQTDVEARLAIARRAVLTAAGASEGIDHVLQIKREKNDTDYQEFRSAASARAERS